MTAPATDGSLREAALRAMEHAYAPYSRFRVGAAVVGDRGEIVVGCNVENSAYPAGICAERAAIAGLVARGEQRVRALVLATEAEEPAPPCGMCRQVVSEFADPSMEVVSVTRAGREARWRVADLLPAPFNPAWLDGR